MSSTTYDVFISYSSRDAYWVRDWLLPRLESAGLRVCIDFRDFAIGKPALDNMAEAATRSRKTLFVMTPNWTVSEFSQFEALVTQTLDPIGRGGRLLPLMLKECDLPMRLRIFTYADFKNPNNWDTEIARVIAAIRESPAPNAETPNLSPLQPNLVHPYALQANFTGRGQERAELTAWLADDPHPICTLVAIGGMGKSALAWVWLTQNILKSESENRKLDGVMSWSFYEGAVSFAMFVDEALKYVSGHDIDASRLPTTYDRALELRGELQTKRVLFVLDGFERQLRAYARLDAAYQRDDTTDSARETRACVDPNAARLLRDLAAGATRGKVLITSRLMVSDLEDRAGDALAGVLRREFSELQRDDAVAFMRAQGVTKGTPAEISTVCEAYGNHPLSLRLLSGLIARDARMPGDIAAAPRHDVHADLIARQHHILEQSYDALSDGERMLLSRIAAFRSPMTYDALAIFNAFGDEPKFETALDDLQARGLLQRDTAHNRFDLHPIVRHYCYDRLTDKTGVHARLRDYFANIPMPDGDKVQSIEDLAPVIELYHHTVRAGQLDEAQELLRDRLVPNPLHFRFGAYQLMIELDRALFPDGEDHPPRLKKESARAWTLNALANSYDLWGQSRRALPLFSSYISISEKSNRKTDQAIGLANIALAHMKLGELAAAEQDLQRQITLCHEIMDEGREADGREELGRLFSYQGDFAESVRELDIASSFAGKDRDRQAEGLNEADRALRSLLMGDPQIALAAAQPARTLADDKKNERDIIQAEWLFGAALVMEGKDINAATAHLAEALTRCRRINLVELEPDILLAWAGWYRAQGNPHEAQAYAEEALAIADRCEYRLKQADIHNFLALLALDVGNRELARKEEEIAKERAWCDGPPHCYKPALDEADKMLKELA